MTDEFDPVAPADAVSHDRLGDLRRQCPVAQTPSGAWYITRHEDVAAASREIFTFEGALVESDGLQPDELFLPFIPEPRHGQVRRVINAAVAAHRLDRIEQPLRALCERLVVPIAERGRAEFIREYVEPIPAAGIGYLLGLPDEDQPQFGRWADALFQGTVLGGEDEAPVRQRAEREIAEYLDAAIAARIDHSSAPDDFITRLVNTEVAGLRLSPLACRTQLIFLLAAGTETTRNLIGNTVYRLAGDPALFDQVKRDRSVVATLIEESLRVDPPLTFLLRRCVADAHVADTALPAGTRVAFGLASANRDDAVFPEPDEFRLDRDNMRKHLSFGDGPHVCPGAALARLEARIAVETIVDRLETLAVEPGWIFRKTHVPFTNGPVTLQLLVS